MAMTLCHLRPLAHEHIQCVLYIKDCGKSVNSRYCAKQLKKVLTTIVKLATENRKDITLERSFVETHDAFLNMINAYYSFLKVN